MKKTLLYLGNSYFSKNMTGVGKYHCNIIDTLKSPFDIAITNSDFEEMVPKHAGIFYISKFKKLLITLFKFILPVEFFFKGYDSIVSDSFSFYSINKKTKLYMIVHDCMSFTEPHNYNWKQKLFSHVSARSYKRADKIIAVSHTTKQTLHVLFKIPYEKIIVIPNITNFYLDNIEKCSRDKFLYIGDMRKTKNLETLIRGFSKYVSKYQGTENLVIAGSKKFEYDKLAALTRALKVADRVIFPGYISEEDKKDLFLSSVAFLFLSDNEGFGIPLLEACVNQVPVLCSDIPVFHEVLNEKYAIFVDNKNEEDVCEGINSVRNKEITIAETEELREKYCLSVFSEKINGLINGNK